MPELRPAADGSIPLAPPAGSKPEEETFNEDALVDKIKGGFAAAFGSDDGDDYDDPDTGDDAGDEDDYQFQTELDDEQDEEEEESAADDDEVDDSNVDDQSNTDAPTIPLAHERSLLANHTREEIKALRKNLGVDGFADYAARSHEKRNAETARMAELGRMSQQFGTPQPQPTPAAPQPHQSTQQRSSLPTKIEPVSVEALREKFGDDDLIDTFATQMNAQAAVLNQMLAQQQQSVQQLQHQEQQALARRVEEFFGSKELEAYKDHYGSNTASLTPQQQEARVRVLQEADALIAGATFQGRTVDIQEALDRAHSALSVAVTEASVRNKIKKQAKQRNRGITVRPNSKRGSKVDLSRSGAPKDEVELQKRTRQRLRQVFS